MGETHYFVLNILYISFCVGDCFLNKCIVGSLYFLTFCLKHLKEQQYSRKLACFEFSGTLELQRSPAAALRIRTLLKGLELRILIYHNCIQTINFICPIKIIGKLINSDCKKTEVALSQRCCCFYGCLPHHASHTTSFVHPLHYLLCIWRDQLSGVIPWVLLLASFFQATGIQEQEIRRLADR